MADVMVLQGIRQRYGGGGHTIATVPPLTALATKPNDWILAAGVRHGTPTALRKDHTTRSNAYPPPWARCVSCASASAVGTDGHAEAIETTSGNDDGRAMMPAPRHASHARKVSGDIASLRMSTTAE